MKAAIVYRVDQPDAGSVLGQENLPFILIRLRAV